MKKNGFIFGNSKMDKNINDITVSSMIITQTVSIRKNVMFLHCKYKKS